MYFSPRSATDRKYIRLQTDAESGCTLFYKQVKFIGETHIIDLSEVSVKISIDALPAGMLVDTKVKISLSLKIQGKLISLSTEATILRINENRRDYDIILLFKLEGENRHNIRTYLANHQMELIREFKKMDIISDHTSSS